MSEATLQQAAQLTELLEQQNKLYAAQGQMLKSQIGLMKQLQDVFSQLDFKDKGTDLEDFTSVIDEAVSEMEGLSKTSQGAMGDMSKALKNVQKDADKTGGSLDKLVKKGPMLASVILAFDGMAEGIKFSTNAMTSMGSVVGTVIGSLGNLAISIITMPFKMLEGLINMTGGGGGGGLKEALEAIRTEFGSLKTGASAAIIDISKSMKGELAETGLSTRKIFGNLADRLKTVTEYAKNMGNAFDLVRDSFVDNAERVGAYIKGLGLSEAGQKALAETAIRTGQSLQEVGREVTTYAYQMGEAFGINGKQISRDVGNMMDDFENFGGLSVQTLTNVSVFARKLGVEVKALQGVIGKFDNFEEAAGNVAQLSQAFGLQLDTLQLVNAQDPAERIEMLRKSFFAAGKSIENMTRQERALLETQTGLDQKTASLVFSLESQGQSYGDIQKQSDATSKKQLSQAEAMEKLSDSIERLVKGGGGQTGGFFDRFLQGFSKGIQKSAEFRELLRNLSKSLTVVFHAGIQVGRAFMDAFPGVKDMTKAIGDFFNPARFKKVMGEVVSLFKKFFKGDLNLDQFQKELKTKFSDFFNIDSPAGQKFKAGVQKFFFKIRDLFIEGLKIGMNALKDGAKFLTNLIKNPTEALAGMSAAGDTIGGFFMNEIISPLVDTITGPAGQEMLSALGELLGVAFDFLIAKIKELAIQYAPQLTKAFLVIFVAPALIGGITRGLIGGLGGALVAGLSGAMKRGITALKKGQETAASAGTPGGGAGAGAIGGRQGNVISRSIDGLGKVMESAEKFTASPAAIKNLFKIGVAFTVVGIAVVGALIGLIKLVSMANITPTDVGKTVMIMGSALAIAISIGLLVKGSQLIGTGGLGKAALGFGAIALTGLAVFKGLELMIEASSLVDLGAVAKVAGVLFATIPILLGLAAVLLILTGAGAVIMSTSGVAAVGLPAMALTIVAAAGMAKKAVESFSTLDIGSMLSTGLLISSLVYIVMGLAAVLLVLTGAGSVVLSTAGVALVGFPVMGLVIVAAAGLAMIAKESFSALDVSQMMEVAAKVSSITFIVGSLAAILVALTVAGGVALFGGLLSMLGGGALIAVIFGAGEIATTAKNAFAAFSPADMADAALKIGSVALIIGALALVSAAMAIGGIATAVGNMFSFFTNSKDNLITLVGDIKEVALKVVEAAQKIPMSSQAMAAVEKVKTVLEVISTYVGIIASLASAAGPSATGALTGTETMITNLTALKGSMREMPSIIGDTVRQLRDVAVEVSAEDLKKIGVVGQILTSVGSFIKSLAEAVKSLPSGDGNTVAKGVEAMTAFISGIGGTLGTLFESVGEAIIGIANTKGFNIKKFTAVTTGISAILSSIADFIKATKQDAPPEGGGGGLIELIRGSIGGFAEAFDATVIADLEGVISRLGGMNIDARTVKSITNFGTVISGIASAMSSMTDMPIVSGKALRNLVTKLTRHGMGENIITLLDTIGPIGAKATASRIKAIESFGTALGSISAAMTDIASNSEAINTDAITRVGGGVSAMIESVSQMINSIRSIGNININSELQGLANRLGLESRENLRIEHGNLSINITFNVKVDAKELEGVLLSRENRKLVSKDDTRP